MPKISRDFFLTLKIIADALAVVAAGVLTYWLRFHSGALPYKQAIPITYYWILIPVFTAMVLSCIAGCGLYRRFLGIEKIDEPYNLLKAVGLAILLLFSGIFLFKGFLYSRLMVGILALLVLVLINAVHFLFRKFEPLVFRETTAVLVVGAGREAKKVVAHIRRHPELRHQIVGFLDDHHRLNELVSGAPVLGKVAELISVLDRHLIQEVIVALPQLSHERILDIILSCHERGIKARVLSDLFEIITDHVRVGELNGLPLLGLKEESLTGLRLHLKHFLDILLATSLLVFGMPLFVLIALLLTLDSPGPVFYTQTRIGLKGRPFKLYKFRSMVVGAERMQDTLAGLNEVQGHIFKIKKDPRITRFGRVLRRLSFDELAQLINVLRAEMSLIGPRPPLPGEVEKYSQWHKRRLDVLPGITGLWQVSGRNELTFEEMVKLDVYYIENWSLWLDLRILFKTLRVVLSTKGAY